MHEESFDVRRGKWTGWGGACMWNLKTGTILLDMKRQNQYCVRCEFSFTDEFLLVQWNSHTDLYDTKSRVRLKEIRLPVLFEIQSAVFTTSNTLIVASMARHPLTHTVSSVETESGAELHRYVSGCNGGVLGALVSRDGSSIAILNGEAITLVDLATGSIIGRIESESVDWRGFVFLPGQPTVAALDREGSIAFIDSVSFSVKARLRQEGHRAIAITANDSGTLVASAGDDGIRVWDAVLGRLVGHFRVNLAGTPTFMRGKDEVVFFDNDRVLRSQRVVRECEGTVKRQEETGKALSEHNGKEIAQLYLDLGSSDVMEAYRARWALVRGGETSVRFLKQAVMPVPDPDEDGLRKLVWMLGDSSFTVRENATRELLLLDRAAEAVVKKYSTERLSPEAHMRLARVRDYLMSHTIRYPEVLRALRVVWVLEGIGSESARELLRQLAGGNILARQTRAARLALLRLKEAREHR